MIDFFPLYFIVLYAAEYFTALGTLQGNGDNKSVDKIDYHIIYYSSWGG